MPTSVHEADLRGLPRPDGLSVNSLYRRTAPWLLCLPALLIITPFLAACLYMLRFSVSAETGVIDGFSLQAYAELAQPFFMRSVLLTLKLAAVSTVIVLILAIPLAIIIVSTRSAVWRRVLTVIVLLPMILNLLIQSYGWILLLGPAGAINTTLIQLGVIERPLILLFNEKGVLLGLVQTALPLAVFPLMSAMRAVSHEYLEAASGLGASQWRSFMDITLPLLKPGLISAGSIVFAFNASAFAVPLLLGGRRVRMLGLAIRDMISPLFNWSGAAAGGMVLILIITLVLVLSTWLVSRSSPGDVS